MNRNSVSRAAGATVKKVCDDDISVVVGGMRKPAAAIAVSESPYPFDRGSKLIIYLDKALAIHR